MLRDALIPTVSSKNSIVSKQASTISKKNQICEEKRIPNRIVSKDAHSIVSRKLPAKQRSCIPWKRLGVLRAEKWPKTGHADDWVYCDLGLSVSQSANGLSQEILQSCFLSAGSIHHMMQSFFGLKMPSKTPDNIMSHDVMSL